MTVTKSDATNFAKQLTDLVLAQHEEELRPTLPHMLPGNFRPAKFVKGTNNTMRFTRMPDLSVTINGGTRTPGTAPWLTEGVAPTAEALSFGYEEFTAAQAGRRVEVSDVAMERDPHDLLAEAAEKVGRNADDTLDAYVAYVVNAGTNVIYAGSGNAARTDVGSGDVVDGRLLRRARASMKTDLIPTFGDGFYRAIIDPAVVFDIQDDEGIGGWLQANTYSNITGGLLTGELGRYAGIRFIESTNAAVFAAGGAGGVDIYSTFIFGPEAYAVGDWGSVTAHYVAPGGHGDELAQVASIGWKANFGAILIDEAGPRYLRIESASNL